MFSGVRFSWSFHLEEEEEEVPDAWYKQQVDLGPFQKAAFQKPELSLADVSFFSITQGQDAPGPWLETSRSCSEVQNLFP